MKINIVIDNPNSWVVAKAGRLMKKIRQLGHHCRLLLKHQLVAKNSDITFFLSCEKYITASTRQKSRYNIVIHASDLPRGRGMSPATWQILAGHNKIKLTLFEVADKIDAGQIYLKNSFQLDGSELIDEWQEKLYCCLEKMAVKFLQNLKTIKPVRQQDLSTFYQRRTKADSQLNPDKTIAEQFNLWRVVDNEKYPAYFNYKKHKYVLKIYKELIC